MRLKQFEVESITNAIKTLDVHAQIYLFGSRTDDAKRGGDIDVLIISQTLSYNDKIKIVQRLYESLGEQKIHIIIAKDAKDPFVKLARNKGILL
ncbi:MAG TPA: nucleotidyltransferase domain-containing protein [Candidatus Brocadiaceae bacterium]|nr:nucleotidyltransferase domain-containing protein [Candidatus Brocadiaceae bacterium]